MALNDWELSYNGLTMGGSTAYSIIQIDGLLDMPELSTSVHGRLRRSGVQVGASFEQGRTITVTMELHATDEADFNTLVKDLSDATISSGEEQNIDFRIPGVFEGEEYRFIGRPERRRLPVNLDFLYHIPRAVIQFYCGYPYAVGVTELVNVISIPTTSGGFTFDGTFDATFGVASVGGGATLPNAGNANADLVFEFLGPIDTPRVTLDGTGKYMEFDLELASGDTLIVDTKSRSVLLGGTTDRYTKLRGAWWTLPPGLANTVSLSASSADSGTVTIRHSPTSV